MSLKKAVAIAAAAGALAAVSSTAMAFESQFNGMYKFKFIVSDFDNGGTGTDSTLQPNFVSPTNLGLKEKNKANSYLEQRARLIYTGKANDSLKMVAAFELDTRFGGTNSGKYGPAVTTAPGSSTGVLATAGSNDGGALDADGISLETKWVYLDFNCPLTGANIKTGVLPYKDAFKGIFLDADAAAVYVSKKLGDANLGLGFARVYDGKGLYNVGTPLSTGTGAFVGDKNTDIYMLEGKYNLTKDLLLGASYYFVASNLPTNTGLAATALLNTLGLTADAKIGAAKISGFAAMQMGSYRQAGAANSTLSGYAFNLAGALPVGPGTLRAAGLFTSGDDNRDGIVTSWQPVKTYKPFAGTSTGASTSAVTSYNEGGMMLLNRNTAQNNTNTDRYIVGTPDNQGKGLILATAGYDANITSKVFSNTNVGFAWAAKNGVQGNFVQNGSNFMGVEINNETGYKMYDNLTASAQLAYVVLGGAYHNTAADSNGVFAASKTPENPYTVRVVLSYAF